SLPFLRFPFLTKTHAFAYAFGLCSRRAFYLSSLFLRGNSRLRVRLLPLQLPCLLPFFAFPSRQFAPSPHRSAQIQHHQQKDPQNRQPQSDPQPERRPDRTRRRSHRLRHLQIPDNKTPLGRTSATTLLNPG